MTKSFQFALRIIKLNKHLKDEHVANELCSQILKSGTSIGANVEEAVGGSSKKDFVSKLNIAYKETRETRYWLKLLKESELLDAVLADSFLKDCEEIVKILTSILKTSKSSNS